MKRVRFIFLSLIITLLLASCERPAPTGEIPAPTDNTDGVPRTDGTSTPIEGIPTTDPTVLAPATPTVDPAQVATAVPPAEGEGTTPTDTTGVGEEATDEAPALEDGVYVVRAGDTLGQIAFAYNISVEDIMAANNLTNADVLDVGQELIIPDAGFADTAVPATPSASTDDGSTNDTTTGQEQVHIVQAGDNLYRIGLQYGFTIDELAQYNNLTDVNNLEVGQEILIPPSN